MQGEGDVGDVMLALDGHFGLVRKASSGAFPNIPKHGQLMFMSDDDVRSFVNNYGSSDKEDKLVSKCKIITYLYIVNFRNSDLY